MKGYWLAMIYEVVERAGYNNDDPAPEVHMSLTAQLGDQAWLPLALPRVGQSFWLVDDRTFKRLVWNEDAGTFR